MYVVLIVDNMALIKVATADILSICIFLIMKKLIDLVCKIAMADIATKSKGRWYLSICTPF